MGSGSRLHSAGAGTGFLWRNQPERGFGVHVTQGVCDAVEEATDVCIEIQIILQFREAVPAHGLESFVQFADFVFPVAEGSRAR